ncbi:hypothetical protein [Streptomyces cupreus]|nr:hypothetical protein [Streptomyces cupreus]
MYRWSKDGCGNGQSVLRQLSREIDHETALAIFKVSGLSSTDQS